MGQKPKGEFSFRRRKHTETSFWGCCYCRKKENVFPWKNVPGILKKRMGNPGGSIPKRILPGKNGVIQGEIWVFVLTSRAGNTKEENMCFSSAAIIKRKGRFVCMGCTKRVCPLCAKLRKKGHFCENIQNISCGFFLLPSFFTFSHVEMTLIFAFQSIKMKAQSIRRRFLYGEKDRSGMEKTF